MLLTTRIKLALAIWIVCEVVAFSLVAHWIGVPRAILVGVITSLLGLSLLRRAGTSALMKLRAGLDGRASPERAAGHFLDETLATVGALALLLPGFLSDLVGLALAAPALRDKVAGWIGRGGLTHLRTGRRAQHGPASIDLEPDEWRQADNANRPLPKV